LAGGVVASGNLVPGLVEFGLNVVSQFEALFEIFLEPVAELFQFGTSELGDGGFDFLNSAHGANLSKDQQSAKQIVKSSRERITTGRVLAARPRSANQMSPGSGFVEEVEDFLFDAAGMRHIQRVSIGGLYWLNQHLRNMTRQCQR